MIQKEQFDDRHIRTFSDAGKMIRNIKTGAEYVEAVDPLGSDREYIETTHPVDVKDVPSHID